MNRNKVYFKFMIFLVSFISTIIMGIVFFIIITPISFLLRILGKDALNLKKINKKTYWIIKDDVKSEMKKQI